jgi:hypothetical protein
MCSRKTSTVIPNVISSAASADGAKPCGSLPGQMTFPFGPEVVPASRLAEPVSEKGLPTSGTCGLNSIGLLESADLQQSLESRLKARLAGHGSALYVLTWKHRVMPSGGAFFLLRASAHRSGGIASIGWQTPTTRDGKGQSGRGNRERRGKGGRLHVANLCDQLVDLGRPDLVRSTAFRCWLMGYRESWEHARPTATR